MAPQSKITKEQGDEIRRRYEAGGVTERSLADEYGVSHVTIHNVLWNKVWKTAEASGAHLVKLFVAVKAETAYLRDLAAGGDAEAKRILQEKQREWEATFRAGDPYCAWE